MKLTETSDNSSRGRGSNSRGNIRGSNSARNQSRPKALKAKRLNTDKAGTEGRPKEEVWREGGSLAGCVLQQSWA